MADVPSAASAYGAKAIRRSFDIYYRDAARTRRMDALNALFVPPGGLAFDIGAHVGDRTASFRRLGARVVALEPQPRPFRALRLIHGRDPGVALVRQAAGARAATMTLHINGRNPMVSTLSDRFVEAAGQAPGWRGEVWDQAAEVSVTTLDALVAAHGIPDFIKIDVEGHERAVLSGLSQPVPALSFEFTTIQREMALACIERLMQLGDFEFNISLGEAHRLRQRGWQSSTGIREALTSLQDAANSGDVHARLKRVRAF